MKEFLKTLLTILFVLVFALFTAAPIIASIAMKCGWFLLAYFLYGILFLWFFEKLTKDMESLFNGVDSYE